ncbi:PfkB family carbohydrate kinase [Glycomyces harbinensis]|uniref:Adenosine kinase n=1 Tax=Glycomyces harbinensis TaxID=58114 RepID=A0A1G6U5F7_9ACTN|nr:PfkB family carbohydrate kinase [Glycomyces harbinensis]SDD36533.1 adenosine kinase [Glycomyces harbinensis]
MALVVQGMKTAVTGTTADLVGHGLGRLGQAPVVIDGDELDLIEIMERGGTLGLIHIGPGEAKAMHAYADQCRDLGLEFSADPGDLEGEEAVEFFTGAKFLVTSQDRYQLLQATTGLSDDEILERVRVRVTTLDQDGVEIAGHDMDRVRVPFARAREIIDPAGGGEAFTAGLLAGLGWGMSLRRAAEVGSQLTALALETVGPQGYAVNQVEFVHRLEQSYGPAAAAEASAYLLPD